MSSLVMLDIFLPVESSKMEIELFGVAFVKYLSFGLNARGAEAAMGFGSV